MSRLKLIISTTLIALLLSACGDESSVGGKGEGLFDSGNTQVSIIACNNANPVFTTINQGDLLVKETTPTSVNIIHDSNNNKKVCVISGSAHLLRSN